MPYTLRLLACSLLVSRSCTYNIHCEENVVWRQGTASAVNHDGILSQPVRVQIPERGAPSRYLVSIVLLSHPGVQEQQGKKSW